MKLEQLYACLLAVFCLLELSAEARNLRLLQEWDMPGSSRIEKNKPLSIKEAEQLIETRLRSRRSAHDPTLHGSHSFSDSNNRAVVYYSGSPSSVILVLTYIYRSGTVRNVKLYRSTNYGSSFTPILPNLDPSASSRSIRLTNKLFISPTHRNIVIAYHASQAKFYISNDEGATWRARTLSPSTLNPRSIKWNPVNYQMGLAHDPRNHQLLVTRNLGASWTKIANYVEYTSNYQWGDPSFDTDPSLVYYNTFDPNDHNRFNFTVSLFTQRSPYTSATRHELDPNLGKHDDFQLLGPYIFAQKSDAQNAIHLYLSYKRQPFQKALIPSTDLHQTYIVSHIDYQQALVIVEHVSGQYNLYLSDTTGIYFSLSLPDIVNRNYKFDLELIEGVNGTLVANQYVRTSPTQPKTAMRTLVSLDNGGNWELVRPPAGRLCSPPRCSLHFHMTNSAYARTGVYSQASAPGLIVAHGNTGRTLSNNPDLYISRDGGVSWTLTLRESWGISVLDHGGMLVAAKDYHNVSSRELRYSCNEGQSWTSFNFSPVPMTVYGVITEPGEYTTTVSLYGTKQNANTWSVVTVNFSSVFPRTCSQSDFYDWHPWDDRTGSSCILGSAVTIERRNRSICCLIGQDYSRPTQVTSCSCNVDDFECDYGYMHSNGFTGSCVRDVAVTLTDPCSNNQTVSYKKSRGYRKVSGDICAGGVESTLGPVDTLCNPNTVSTAPTDRKPTTDRTTISTAPTDQKHTTDQKPTTDRTTKSIGPQSHAGDKGNTNQQVTIALGVLFGIVVLVAISFALSTVFLICKITQLRRRYLGTVSGGNARFQFRSGSPSAEPMLSIGTEDEDDAPLAL